MYLGGIERDQWHKMGNGKLFIITTAKILNIQK